MFSLAYCRLAMLTLLSGCVAIGEGVFVQMKSYSVSGQDAVGYLDGQGEVLEEGEVRQWTCEVKEATASPTVIITLGDRDITSHFVQTTFSKVSGRDRQRYYEAVLTAAKLEAGYEFDGKDLVCSASLPERGVISRRVRIELSGYRPHFACPTVVWAELGERDAKITCTTRAKPPVHDIKFKWEKQENSTPAMSKIKADLRQGSDEYETVMQLNIDEVREEHFGTYRFWAENVLGNATQKIALDQLQTDTKGKSYLKRGTTASSVAHHVLINKLGLYTLLVISCVLCTAA